MHISNGDQNGRNTVLAETGASERFVSWASPGMQAIDLAVADIASRGMPLLLIGERGTGKQVLAQRIHQVSRRRAGPLWKLRCSDLTTTELDRLLQGDHGGGRDHGSPADGTILLQEISELNPPCQARLLQLFSTGNTYARGIPQGPGVISTTSRNLYEDVRLGSFWDELYYRVAAVTLHLPPLRYRKEDIPLLAEFFLDRYATLFGQTRPSLDSRTLRVLLEYAWPGNIRELENAAKRMVALGDEKAALAGLGIMGGGAMPTTSAVEGQSLKQAARAASRQAERELILKVLAQTRWNRKRAAQELKVSYKALLYKLKQIGLEDSVRS